MFIWSALDESADRLQKDAYAVAGLLATSEDWFESERIWNRYLERKGIKYFKTSEYRGLKGQFGKFRDNYAYPVDGAGRAASREILNDLSQIIRTSPIVGLVIGMNLRDYREIRRSSRARYLLPQSPYRHMYQTSLVRVASFTASMPTPQSVAFLCDEHSKAAQLAQSYPELKRLNPISGACMGSLSFKKDEDSAAIQMADLIAGLCKDFFVRKVKGTAENCDRISLESEIGKHIGLGYIDKPLLRKLIQANTLKNGKPSICSSLQQKLFDDLFEFPQCPT